MPFLKYIKYFIVLFLSFQTAYAQDRVVPRSFVLESSEGLVFNTSIDHKNFHISGLSVIKKESEGFHIVVVSKIGVTIIDFILLDTKGIKWIKALPGNPKKMVLKQLERDFRTLLLTPLDEPDKSRFTLGGNLVVKKGIKLKLKLNKTTNNVIKAKRKGLFVLLKGKATYIYNNQKIPSTIQFHKNWVSFVIAMERMN